MLKKLWLVALWSVAVVSAVGAQSPTAESAKLTAPALFPERTLAYLRIGHVKELKEALGRSTIGKLAEDEQLKPILSEFYGSLINSTEALREYTGLNLEEILSIPTGELALAILPSDRAPARRGSEPEPAEARPESNRPCVAVMMDAGEEIAGVQVLLQRLDTALADRVLHEEAKCGSLVLHLYSNADLPEQRFGYFIDQGVFVGCSSFTALERLAQRWSGQSVDWPSLAENRKFTAIMGRCVGTQGERPQISFFVDPLALGSQLAPVSATSTMVFAVLPALGLNDIQAIGGSGIVAPPDFDTLWHFHILLGSPRRAILALLRPKTGSVTPENWVPTSVSSYFTINWDAQSTLKGIEQLYNQFRGEDAMDNEVFKRATERLGVDFKREILENLEGRFTLLQGFTRPVRLNSGSNVYAIRLKNPEAFSQTVLPALVKLVEKRREVKTEQFGQLQAYVFVPRSPRNNSSLRGPEVCITMIDDYLVVSDSRFMLTEINECLTGDQDKLSEALDFQMIYDRIQAQLQGKECSGLQYSRPEESLQLFYELAQDPANRERLREMSADSGFFKALLAALDKHELPPFSVIAKYLAPTGGFLVEEETGLHYMSFGERRE